MKLLAVAMVTRETKSCSAPEARERRREEEEEEEEARSGPNIFLSFCGILSSARCSCWSALFSDL